MSCSNAPTSSTSVCYSNKNEMVLRINNPEIRGGLPSACPVPSMATARRQSMPGVPSMELVVLCADDTGELLLSRADPQADVAELI
jgi:hypothetical protein